MMTCQKENMAQFLAPVMKQIVKEEQLQPAVKNNNKKDRAKAKSNWENLFHQQVCPKRNFKGYISHIQPQIEVLRHNSE